MAPKVYRAITNIKKALVKQETEIMSIASMLMIVGIITKVFGMLSDSISAGYLGSSAYDKFVFASNLPELISQIFLFGAISSSILPILSKVLIDKGEKRFIRVFSTLINISLIIFIILALLIVISADHLLPWFIHEVIRPKNTVSYIEIEEMVSMLRVMMIPQIILGVSVYFSTALNIYERFLVPQLAPLFYNLGRIFAVFFLKDILDKSAWVLVAGTLIGAFLHIAIQIPVVRHIGIKYRPIIDIKDYFIKQIGTVSLPRILSSSIEQIAITIDRFIAFGLVGNSLGLYNLALKVVSVPLSLFGVSYATASFPSLAKAFNKKNRILASEIFLKIYNQILFLAIPFSVLLFVLRVPIARLVFGIFGTEIKFIDTYTIAWVILFFSPGIIFESLRIFIFRTYYAVHDTVRPLIVSLFTMFAGAITGILFTNYFSHFNTFAVSTFTWDVSYFFQGEEGVAAVGGLALSSTIIFTIESFVLLFWLNKRYLKLKWLSFIKPVMKKLFAGFVMTLVCYLIYKIWADHEMTKKTVFLVVLTLTTAASSAMIYIGISWVLSIEEVEVYIRFLQKYPNKKMLKRTFKRFGAFNPIADESM